MKNKSFHNPAYFRELRGYTIGEIAERMKGNSADAPNVTIEDAKRFVDELRKYEVVKAVRGNKLGFADITNEDLVLAENVDDVPDSYYKFDFVGVAVVQDRVFFSYPKYVDNLNDLTDEKRIFEELHPVIKAIQKYNSQCELVHLYNGSDKGSFNRLAIALHILNDYYENGIYTNTEQVIETNGEGEIDWDRTINETFAYLKNNRPYYLELKTIAVQSDEYDFFKRLHECIVTECSKYLAQLNLLELFDLSAVELSEDSLSDFGDSDFIEYRLEREIGRQFVTRKQNLLKTLYTFVAEESTNATVNSFSLYGTNSLNLVWEKACGKVFDNKFKDGVFTHGSIRFELEKPKWKVRNEYSSDFKETTKNTLIPDIVTIGNVDGRDSLFILDGKYYFVECDKGEIRGNPGVQDVVKQFVYHKAFLSLIEKCGYPNVFNAFLFPGKTSGFAKGASGHVANIDVCGEVSFLEWGVNSLVPIHIVFVDPKFIWKAYVDGKSCKAELENAVETVLKDRHEGFRYSNIIPFVPTLTRAAEPQPEYDAARITKDASADGTIVGYLKNDYLNQIEGCGAKKILFYFYRNRNGFVYPLHPDISKCSKFIGYGDDGRMIQGNVGSELLVCTPEKLGEMLAAIGLPRNAGFSADEYYVLEVDNVGAFMDEALDSLKDKIKQYPGNDITHDYSPKVIK